MLDAYVAATIFVSSSSRGALLTELSRFVVDLFVVLNWVEVGSALTRTV